MCGHKHHHHQEHGHECSCGGGGCDCDEGAAGCGCGCHCGCGGHHGEFQRRYQTKAEQIAELEAYQAELKVELEAVEEQLADLRR